jgi:hypothetical protein
MAIVGIEKLETLMSREYSQTVVKVADAALDASD